MRKETPFAGCTALTELRLEHGVTRGDWIPTAPALTAFRVPADHPHLTVEDGALYSKDKKTLLRVPMGRTGEWIVPRGVVEIGAFAFSGCVGITEVVLPSTLRTIAEGAFSGCTSLCSIDFPGKLTDIGACAFADCTALARVHITSGIRHIGENAFAGCAALRALTVSPQNSKYRIDDGKLVSL